MYKAAVGAWGIAPSEFWAMSPREWWWIWEAKQEMAAPDPGGVMDDGEVAELLRWRDEMKDRYVN